MPDSSRPQELVPLVVLAVDEVTVAYSAGADGGCCANAGLAHGDLSCEASTQSGDAVKATCYGQNHSVNME